MMRIAIATLALTMLGVPVLALGLAPARDISIPHAPASAVNQDQVIALARRHGLVRVANFAFENGVWTVRGSGKGGRRLEVDVSSAGEVLDPNP